MTSPRPLVRTCLPRSGLRLLPLLSGFLGLLGLLTGPSAAAEEPTPIGAWPLRPTPSVAARFEPPLSAWGAGHRGVDLTGAPGQSVRAALPGRVSFAGRIAGRGTVVVDHGSSRTTYEPVLSAVEIGSPVGRGQPIGTLELGGSHCFPRACLHWGWLRGTTYLDPLLLVGAGPVRLLPLGQEPARRGIGLDPRTLHGRAWAPTPHPYAAWQGSPGAGWPHQARGCACW